VSLAKHYPKPLLALCQHIRCCACIAACCVCAAQALQDLLHDPKEADAVRADILNLLTKPRCAATASPAPGQGAAASSVSATANTAHSTAGGSVDARTELCKALCAAERSALALVQPLQPSISQRLQLLGLTRELANLQHTGLRVARFRVDLRVREDFRFTHTLSSASVFQAHWKPSSV
jgi:hypothetical protein